MTFEQTTYLRGRINMDDHILSAEFKEVDEYIYAINFQSGVGEGSERLVGRNMRGNTEVSYTLPDGDNKVIGKLHDKEHNSVIYMVWNSNSDHRILRYYYDGTMIGKIVEVANGSVLGFKKENNVTGISLSENILQWNDGNKLDGNITGNPPRRINLDKAISDGKKKKLRVYFQRSYAFNENLQYYITIYDANGSVLSGFNALTVYTVPIGGKTLAEGIQGIADGINAASSGLYVTATACDSYLEIEMKQEKMECKMTMFDLVSQYPSQKILNVPYNYYPALTERHIDLLRYPPKKAPQGTYKSDSGVAYNYVESKTFQFIMRYVYDDWDMSRWSDISKLVFDAPSCLNSNNNYIEIDYSQPELVDESVLSIIKYVELGFREGNTGKWKYITKIAPEDFDYPTQKYKFYNDGVYPAIPEQEISIQYDNVPRLALGHALSKNRSHFAGVLMGYDAPECVDMGHSITYETVSQDGTWTLKGRLKIHNYFREAGDDDLVQVVHDLGDDVSHSSTVYGGIGKTYKVANVGLKYKQWLPLGGFVVYIAGTPYHAVTKQVRSSTVSYADNDKNIYDSSTSSKRSDIRDAMKNEDIYQEFEIKNIPPGRYVVRVASNWVSEGDELGYGEMYDITSGTSYQGTSVPIIGVGNNVGQKEIEVDLSDTSGGTKDLDNTTEVFIVGDLTDVSVTNSVAYQGYLIDGGKNGADNTVEGLQDGIRCELQVVRANKAGGVAVTGVTDHNGFYYITYQTTTVNYDPFNRLMKAYYNADYIINDDNDFVYEGGLGELNSGSLIKTNKVDVKNALMEYIVPNVNKSFTDEKKRQIVGTVKSSDGKGAKDVSVFFTRTGRYDKTDSAGQYKISVFADSQVSGNTRSDNLLFKKPSGCDITLSTYLLGVLIEIRDGVAKDNPYTAADVTVTEITSEGRWLKRGGVYPWGIVYEDDGGRKSPVARDVNMKISIPYHTENGTYGKPKVVWSVNHQPPSWAKRYQIVRAKNQATISSLVWPVNDVKYVTRYQSDPATDKPIETTYQNGDATEIYLGFKNLKTYQEENTNSLLGFPEEVSFDFSGTRIRFIYNEDGGLYTEMIDVEVRGRRGEHLIIEALENIPQLKAGVLVELYDPRKKADDDKLFYYAVSEKWDIIDAGLSTRRHDAGYNGQAQVIGTQPATGEFVGGDTYWVTRDVPILNDNDRITKRYAYLIESSSVSDFYESEAEDIGRPVIEDENGGEKFYETLHVFSDPIFHDSKINGLSAFNPLNRYEFPREYGAIRSLVMAGNVLLQLHEDRPVSIYIGENMLVDGAGQQIVSVSNKVIGTFRPQAATFGTKNPESVMEFDTKVVWWDEARAALVRYDNNGSYPISNYKFTAWARDMVNNMRKLKESERKVHIGYDPYLRQYIVSFEGGTYDVTTEVTSVDLEGNLITSTNTVTKTIEYQTIGFSESHKGIKSFYSWEVDDLVEMGDKSIAFKDGKLWIQHSNDEYGNFFGQHYDCTVKFVMKPYPDVSKVWEALQLIGATNKWEIVSIKNNEGQETRIKETKFEKTEKDYYADIPRDINSNTSYPIIDGEVIRSAEIVIEMKQTRTSMSEIVGIRCIGEVSAGTYYQ